MPENAGQTLRSVPETSLMAVYIRAMESQRPDALIVDEKAVALVAQMSDDFARFEQIPMNDALKVMRNLATREYDRQARDFLARHPDAVVVHVGCGLDSRFERVCSEQPDNGRVEWYDLDLPEVIELRRKLVGGEGARHHFLACSVFDSAWLSEIGTHRPRPVLFLAEGVFMYFREAQVKSLVLTMKEHFPGAELVFDAYSPFLKWTHNLRVTRKRIGAHLHWALKHPQDLERWSEGIRLLDERYPFQYPEPRLRRALKVRLVPFLATGIGVFRYQLSGGRHV
jgi:O-methyltransferase involved in polyketide biosynthesis